MSNIVRLDSTIVSWGGDIAVVPDQLLNEIGDATVWVRFKTKCTVRRQEERQMRRTSKSRPLVFIFSKLAIIRHLIKKRTVFNGTNE